MGFQAGSYDVAVIGAGHAGCEAGAAAAKLGCSTVIFTINMDSVGNLPCNPSIGGTAKGHLVREIDALGGVMGRAADATTIQSRMLNRGKGPAVHSLRAQIDRRAYGTYMKRLIEQTPNLDLRQGEIVSLTQAEDGRWLLTTRMGAVYDAACVILATGTYLGGKVFVGEVSYESGPDGLFPATYLTDSLKQLGLPLRRFKTGTPARVHRSSIDFSNLEEQPGDEPITPFSYATDPATLQNRAVCHMTWTNDETKRVILENLSRSPLYAGEIEGVGPRYCPSIEDKVVRFAEKKRHPVFLEPCGMDTEEIYLQGMSSSLPEEVQLQFYRTVPGLENLKIMRCAYAIEYDCIDPTALRPTLESKTLPGLFGAGQFNGSSGYEEAAGQGLLAGINAARRVQGKQQIILPRSGSYLGTLVDDLVTKGCADPYRMMTSRSEYRLVLRQDNADERLMQLGYELGMVDQADYDAFLTRMQQKATELKRVQATTLPPSEGLNAMLVSRETTPVTTGVRLLELLRRPGITYADLTPFDTTRPADLTPDTMERVQTEVVYEGYIRRQMGQLKEAQRLENTKLPEDLDYFALEGISLEAREKLDRIRPASLGQAGRISGVSPADVSVLLVYLKTRNE